MSLTLGVNESHVKDMQAVQILTQEKQFPDPERGKNYFTKLAGRVFVFDQYILAKNKMHTKDISSCTCSRQIYLKTANIIHKI